MLTLSGMSSPWGPHFPCLRVGTLLFMSLNIEKMCKEGKDGVRQANDHLWHSVLVLIHHPQIASLVFVFYDYSKIQAEIAKNSKN